MRALIVDYDVYHGAALRHQLARDGWIVDVAASVRQARQALAAHAFGLLLIAVEQPDGSGFQLCADVRDQHGHGPIVMLMSWMDTPLQRTTGLQLGADDVLRTPCDLAELTARVAAHQRRRAMLDQIGLLERAVGDG